MDVARWRLQVYGKYQMLSLLLFDLAGSCCCMFCLLADQPESGSMYQQASQLGAVEVLLSLLYHILSFVLDVICGLHGRP
jgi:hypothetical protein